MFARIAEKPWIVLLLASFLFLLQALPLFQTRWVEDDSWYSIVAYSYLQTGQLRHITFNPDDVRTLDSRPPLMTFVLAASFKLLGVGIWQARVPSLLFALGTVWVTFFVGLELGGAAIGALAALLAACDTFLVITARCARPDSAATFCSMLAVLFYLYCRRKDSMGYAVACGLSLGAGMLMHVNGLAGALGVGLLILIDYPLTFWRNARVWVVVLISTLCLAPCFYLLAANPAVMASFRAEYLSRTDIPLGQRLMDEGDRYAGWIGLTKIGSLPFRVPLRLPIVIVALASLVIAFKKYRTLCITMIALWIPNIAWLIYQDNKTLRFLARIAPIIAILVAAAVVGWYRESGVRAKLAVAVCLLFGAMELGGNALLTYQYRNADYREVGEQLRELIPPGQSVFGAITFWMPLYDHPYMSYNRTTLSYAIEHHLSYWILNDRLMVKGEGEGKPDIWAKLRTDANAYAQAHGELVGHIDNPFYGDMQVYHIRY